MASSQGTSVSSNSFNILASHDIFLFKYHFLLHILRFLIFFSDNITAYVASKQQTTALFLSTIVTRTRRHTKLTQKTDKPDGKPVLCQRIFCSIFRAVFYTAKLHSLTYSVWGPLDWRLHWTAPATVLKSGTNTYLFSYSSSYAVTTVVHIPPMSLHSVIQSFTQGFDILSCTWS
jgi:hypothetical protein